MVEAIVDEFERNDFSMEVLAEDRVHTDIRSLSIPTEPGIGQSQEIARALKVKAGLHRHDVIPLPAKPTLDMRLLSLALRMSEVTHDGRASDNQSGIRRKHKIR